MNFFIFGTNCKMSGEYFNNLFNKLEIKAMIEILDKIGEIDDT